MNLTNDFPEDFVDDDDDDETVTDDKMYAREVRPFGSQKAMPSPIRKVNDTDSDSADGSNTDSSSSSSTH